MTFQSHLLGTLGLGLREAARSLAPTPGPTLTWRVARLSKVSSGAGKCVHAVQGSSRLVPEDVGL